VNGPGRLIQTFTTHTSGNTILHKLLTQQLAQATCSSSGEIDIAELTRLVNSAYEASDRVNGRLIDALEAVSEGIALFDADDCYVFWNKRYEDMYPNDGYIAVGMTFEDFLRARIAKGRIPDAKGREEQWLAARLAQHRQPSQTHEQHLPGDQWARIEERQTVDGGTVTMRIDITELKHREMRIAHLAQHDTLTGLPNRAAFNERLRQTLEQAANSGAHFSVVCVDLDRFKEVNDVFGHAAGDTLLQETAARLREASGDAFVARIGGDEFTLVVTGGDQRNIVANLAERLQTAMAAPILIPGHALNIGLSIGVALFPEAGLDAESLIANADAALYRAKAEGRNNICVFDAHAERQIRDRRSLQRDLRSAIDRDELLLHYQPQARINKEVTGFEALIRWKHPTRGLISPGDFIPLAEQDNFINTMGEWVLRAACREAASWNRPLQLAVNLSPMQFRSGDLPNLVHAILIETGLKAERLELEITESLLVEDFNRVLSMLRRLKALGVRIALDDFGTGYSSLSYLQTFPFDKLKIDRAFISSMCDSPQSSAIVQAVIALGGGLGLTVVAEGVETQAQFEFLRQNSCTEIQGYLIGRPSPIEAYSHLFSGRRKVEKQKLAG
jgi:diguanylate cyclase (GGDEF)-like protein